MSAAPVLDPVAVLGARTRAARCEKSLTQAQLAEAAHVSRSFVHELEKGHARAELGKVLNVVEALGLELTLVPRTVSVEDLAIQERAEVLADLFEPQVSGGATLDATARQVVEQYIAGRIGIDEAIEMIGALPIAEKS